MTHHLPECNYDKNPEGNVCICERLRACEERVHEAAYQAGKAYGLTVTGYTRGLDAARAAVEKMNLHGCLPRGAINCNCIGPKIITAIDALRDGAAVAEHDPFLKEEK